jgi:hypothetical protein
MEGSGKRILDCCTIDRQIHIDIKPQLLLFGEPVWNHHCSLAKHNVYKVMRNASEV